MTEQLEVAMLLGGGLSAAGFVRVYVTNGSLLNAFAISVSLLAIVFASVLLGTGLPFVLARGGVDPAHAGTSIQVRAGQQGGAGQEGPLCLVTAQWMASAAVHHTLQGYLMQLVRLDYACLGVEGFWVQFLGLGL